MNKIGKLTVKLFNYVDIEYNGKTIFKEKQLTAKLKSLLQYFLLNHSSICKPDKIIEDLWPDNEYIERKKVLQTYVHRLRNAFTKDNMFDMDFSDKISITNTKGNYIFNISDEVIFDIDVFTQLTKKTSDINEYDELISTTKELGHIYDGHFLQDCPLEKLTTRQRNYYLQLYCGAISTILEKLQVMEKYDDIIAICESFFRIEELDNVINSIFLNALLKTQQTNYAAKHYAYIESKMKETYGLPMPEELTKIMQSLQTQSSTKVFEGDQALDKDEIKNFISDMIREKLRDSQVKYSFAQIEFKTPRNKKLDESIMEDVLQNSLRKNDMYTLITNKTAIALLYQARAEYFETITERIVNYINSHYPDQEIMADITIWPVTNII